MTDDVKISNISKQRIDISIPPKKVNPTEDDKAPTIEISHLWHLGKMKEFDIKLDTKVPKELSILPQISNQDVSSVEDRENCKIYVEAGNTPSYATLEQLKDLNTKTVFVDELTDTEIHKLSNEDIVMLRKHSGNMSIDK